jgi:hypothetical protein
MAILGANYGEVAIPKVGGGYNVSTVKGNTIQHSTVAVPKKTTYKAPAAPKYVAPKAVAAPTASAGIQTVAAPTAAPVAPPPPTLDDLINKYYAATQGDINTLYDKQNSQQQATLKSQQDTATANTKQDYYTKRNAADVVNAQNVQKLRELMASQGIAASGDNLTLNAKANSDRLNSLNTLNTQEQAALNDINNPSKAQAITNAIETARAQALLNAKQSAYNRAWGEFQYNNPSAYQQASLAMSKYNLDSTNAANSAANQAALDYYNSMGFNGSSGGGGTAASGNAAFNQNMASAVKRGVDSSWVPILTEIVRRESSFNPNAHNPTSTAYGYGQFLDSTRSAYEKKTGLSYNDPVNQLIMMAQYVKDRYGNPQNALAFWNKNHWY